MPLYPPINPIKADKTTQGYPSPTLPSNSFGNDGDVYFQESQTSEQGRGAAILWGPKGLDVAGQWSTKMRYALPRLPELPATAIVLDRGSPEQGHIPSPPSWYASTDGTLPTQGDLYGFTNVTAGGNFVSAAGSGTGAIVNLTGRQTNFGYAQFDVATGTNPVRTGERVTINGVGTAYNRTGAVVVSHDDNSFTIYTGQPDDAWASTTGNVAQFPCGVTMKNTVAERSIRAIKFVTGFGFQTVESTCWAIGRVAKLPTEASGRLCVGQGGSGLASSYLGVVKSDGSIILENGGDTGFILASAAAGTVRDRVYHSTTVTTAPSPSTSGTTVVVNDVSLFPAAPFMALIGGTETVNVTAVNVGTKTLTITRAQEQSSARAVVNGDTVLSLVPYCYEDYVYFQRVGAVLTLRVYDGITGAVRADLSSVTPTSGLPSYFSEGIGFHWKNTTTAKLTRFRGLL
jgi:hypothetical protein